MTQAQRRREFDRAVQHDAFGLHAAAGEVTRGGLGILRRDADVTPRPRIVLGGKVPRLADREPAAADAEVERGVNLRVVEFHQHVVAGDAEVRGAEGDKGGDIERAHADEVHAGHVRGEAQLSRVLVVERRLGLDAHRPQHRHQLLEDAALGQR